VSNRKSALKAEPIPWLLEPDGSTELAEVNPSVRYWTLRDLLDRPEDDAEVQAARAAVVQSDVVQRLLAARQPDGYWGDDPRLPWGMALPALKTDPSPILPILEQLRDDEEESVRRSVANCFCQAKKYPFDNRKSTHLSRLA
jgi:hypothetical protein